jgi:tetratricopeptide (TPR) repeat protein
MATALAEWDRGISAMETAAAPRGYQQHIELAVAYRTRGRPADALREFDAAAALQPSASDVHVLRALTLEAVGRFEEAGTAFLTAWRRDTANPVKAYYVAMRRGISIADRDRARARLAETYRALPATSARSVTAPFVTLDAVPDNISPSPVVADDATAEGFALLGDGKYAEAATALKRAAHADGDRADDSPLIHFARAQRAEADNQVSEARRNYRAALTGAIAGRSVLLVAIARLAEVEGDAAGAIDALNQAVRLDPDDLNVRQELAAAYAAQGHTDEAFCELMAALFIDPRHAQTHASIGQLYLDAGRTTEAVTAFNRALELAPERYEIRYSLATAHARLGNAAEAERQLEIFDRLRREALEKRRRDIANEVEREERRRER